MSQSWIRAGAFAFCVALAAIGCDDDPCEVAAEKICAKGCECGSGECAFGDATTQFSVESRSDCELLFKYACSDSSGGIDWGQCQDDVEATTCEGEAFPIPDSCEEPI